MESLTFDLMEQYDYEHLPVDIYYPCALGAVLNDTTIPALRCKIVCGAANNQLAEDRHGDLIAQREIVYAPDYIVNAGGALTNIDKPGTRGLQSPACSRHSCAYLPKHGTTARDCQGTGHPYLPGCRCAGRTAPRQGSNAAVYEQG